MNVATKDSLSPLSRVVFVVKGGSRHEDPSNLGITHFIRHAVYLVSKDLVAFSQCLSLHERRRTAGHVRQNSRRSGSFLKSSVPLTGNFFVKIIIFSAILYEII